MRYKDIEIGQEYAAEVSGEKTIVVVEKKEEIGHTCLNLRTKRTCNLRACYLKPLVNQVEKYLVYHGSRTVSRPMNLQDAVKQMELMLRVGYSNILITKADTAVECGDLDDEVDGQKMILKIPVKVV